MGSLQQFIAIHTSGATDDNYMDFPGVLAILNPGNNSSAEIKKAFIDAVGYDPSVEMIRAQVNETLDKSLETLSPNQRSSIDEIRYELVGDSVDIVVDTMTEVVIQTVDAMLECSGILDPVPATASSTNLNISNYIRNSAIATNPDLTNAIMDLDDDDDEASDDDDLPDDDEDEYDSLGDNIEEDDEDE